MAARLLFPDIMMYIASLMITFLYYLVLGVSFYGWGVLAVGIFRRTHPSFGELSPPLMVWMGFAVWLLILQVIHLAVPVTAYTVIPLLTVGVAISGVCLVRASRQGARFNWPLNDRKSAYSALFFGLVILWIASRSMMHPTNYDAGLYYMTSVRWINSYPIVPGLGNLHGRLAFNQSFFTYVAGLNLYPFFGYGRSIANSFLLILSMTTVLHMLKPVLAKSARILELPAQQWMPPLFVMPVLVFFSIFSKDLASPGPDLAVNLLLILLFLLFSSLLDAYLRKGSFPLSLPVTISILSATAITVKISLVVPIALIAGLTVMATLRKSERIWRDTATLVLTPAVILMVWMGRGIITSGAPFFPSTFGYIQTDWSMPAEAIIREANTIYGWARTPWVHYSEVIGNWNWLDGWIQRLQYHATEVLYPAASFVLLVLYAFALRWTKREKAGTTIRYWWVLSIPLLAGLVFWFFTAPDPRFAQALFFLLPVSAVIPVGLLLQEKYKGLTFILIIGILFTAVNFNYFKWITTHKESFFIISYEGWHERINPPMKIRHTNSGLSVYTPANVNEFQVWDAACWDAPLPCTPVFNKHLKLRRESDLSKGFTIEKNEIQ